MSRSFFVRTYGCQMNEHDSEQMTAELLAAGMVPAVQLEDADVVVLNGCCIRENADNKLYGQLGHLRRLRQRRPDVQIAVTGCLAQKDGEALRQRAPHVDLVAGTFNVARIAELLDRARREGPLVAVGRPGDDEPAGRTLAATPDGAHGVRSGEGVGVVLGRVPGRRPAHSAFVTIQIGCDNACAFCIVPAVRGPEVSRPLGEILSEVRALAANGVVEVTLLGQNVNSYGRDLTVARRAGVAADDVAVTGARWAAAPRRRARPLFGDLLREVGAVEGIRRVRFTSPHPKDLRGDVIEAMAETSAVCEQLHLPLQSGSDRILSAMRRGYSADRYLERLGAARRAIPDLAVTTDIIVGFPGETEDDFEATLAVVAEVGYDSAYTFQFSPRPGTRAASAVSDFVPREVIQERFERLLVVVERAALARHRERVGRREEVLVEGPHPRDPGLVAARTRQGKLVQLPAGALRAGDFVEAEITAAGAHHLAGELVAARAPTVMAGR